MEKNIFIKIFRVNTAEYGTGPHLRYLCRVPVPVPGTGTDTEYGTGTYVRYGTVPGNGTNIEYIKKRTA